MQRRYAEKRKRPPESSACANPSGPFPPGLVPPIVPGELPPTR